MHTSASIHLRGTAEQTHAPRQATLNQAYAAHPERSPLTPVAAPTQRTWINQPVEQSQPTTYARLSHLT